ncbi:MFS transporter [Erythrobacter ani]|uniref:MFS transporter n=1 Tax=Erythrobacter ani TaxID=2827235 RepID=A0ABS6SMC2_9SPHN|nr:MFS transporter [Erythrobacter ani]MBV7266193.1 MFS transporter [Erythrobacter ani]
MGLVKGKLPMRLKLIHGFGAVAFGVKDIGFQFFLLFFYSQVLGMEASLVSLALLCALLIDAVVDPILGNLSDRTYTKWGRRLPWLYAAPIPLAIAWVLMWTPPGGEAPTFWGLLSIAVVVRVLLSACEVPSISLLPEITSDYDERTTLFRFRYISGWLGGILMMVLAYTVFMPGEGGLLNRDGYVGWAITGGGLIILSVMGSALGQHKLVAHLPATKPEPFTIRACFAEIVEAFRERAFLIFAAGGLAAYVNQGLTFSLTNYLTLYVWRLDTAQMPLLPEGVTALSLYPLALFLSAILMFFVVGPMHKHLGKPKSAAVSALGTALVTLAPYLALYAGFWPPLDTALSGLMLLSLLIVGNMLGIVVLISASSMIAEIVEAYLERTGRRAEGAFYSGNWLIQKCATGLGIFLTGQVLSAIDFARDAAPGEVPASTITELIIFYTLATTILMAIAAYWLGRFPIKREDHEARVAALAARQTA